MHILINRNPRTGNEQVKTTNKDFVSKVCQVTVEAVCNWPSAFVFLLVYLFAK